MNNIVMMRGRAMNRIMRPGINPTVKKPGFPIPQPLGPELVVVSDWIPGTGWTIAGGKASKVPGVAADLSQVLVGGTLKASTSYLVTFKVLDYVAGAIVMRFTGAITSDGTYRVADGTYTETIISAADNSTIAMHVQNLTFDGSVTNISIKEVLS